MHRELVALEIGIPYGSDFLFKKSTRDKQGGAFKMNRILCPIHIGSIAAMVFFAVLGAASSKAQDEKPLKTRGISLAASDKLLLGDQTPELDGYALQIRTIVLKPGAVAAYHSHAKRPVVAYLVKGDYTEHRDGQGIVVHKPGDQWVEGADVAHWSENRGNETTYLINVEIVHQQ